MDEIIACLEQSIQDDLLSGSERKDLKVLIAEFNPDQNQVNFLRSKVFDIALSKTNESNHKFIIEWIKESVNATMVQSESSKSVSLFSPGESCREAIIGQISQAKRSLDICVFTISDDTISEAILQAHNRNIRIQIITDNDKLYDVGSDITRMRDAGIVIRIDNTSDHMHHKFMIADDHTVLTGSYNWTRSAAKFNYENIVLTSEPGVVKSFLKEFGRLWQIMVPY